MNKIITTDILDPSIQQPFTGPSLEFLQDSSNDMVLGLARSIIGNGYNSSTPYIIHGVTKSGNTYGEGWILFQDELFYTPGRIISTSFSATAVGVISDTPDATADPVTFTDGIPRNVHRNRTISILDQTAGTGDFNMSSTTDINTWNLYTTTLTAYDSSDVLVAGGVTSSLPQYTWRYRNNKLEIVGNMILTISSGVRYILFSLPMAVPAGKTFNGTGAAFLYNSSSGTPSVVWIALRSTGAGSPLTLNRLDYADYTTLTNYILRFSISIGEVGT